jgi:hypothetical protein
MKRGLLWGLGIALIFAARFPVQERALLPAEENQPRHLTENDHYLEAWINLKWRRTVFYWIFKGSLGLPLSLALIHRLFGVSHTDLIEISVFFIGCGIFANIAGAYINEFPVSCSNNASHSYTVHNTL